ncbi:MAG: DEAD/DEAH box helicase family protein, partial [Nitrospira sp.]|nr:DEAD/DEAH box helicase family protein [Nitrospira sp.]
MTSNLVDNQSPNTHKDVLNSKGTKPVHQHMAFAAGYVYLSGLRELRPILQRVADARGNGLNDSLRVLMGRSTDKETHTWVAQTQNKAERRNAASEEAVKVAEELGDSKAFKPGSDEVETLEFLDLLKGLMTLNEGGFTGLEFRIIPDRVLHAKAYLFTDDKPVEGQGLSDTYDGSGYALAGSANLTHQGLTRNLELGLGSSNAPELKAMAAWFEKLWVEAVPVNETLLDEAQQHWPMQQPSLEDLFLRMQYLLVEQELDTPLEAQQHGGLPLADFQLESISEARWRLEQRGGVMLAHVVGLGKTFMGAKLLKALARRHGLRQILVFCPRPVRSDWIAALKEFEVFKDAGAIARRVISVDMLGQHATPEEIETGADDTLYEDQTYSNLNIRWEGSLLAAAELILVDESHRLRNPNGKNYKNLKRAIEDMQVRAKRLSPEAPGGGGVIFCTATPIAKEVSDVFRQLELFWKEKWIPGSEIGWDEAVKIVQAASELQ